MHACPQTASTRALRTIVQPNNDTRESLQTIYIYIKLSDVRWLNKPTGILFVYRDVCVSRLVNTINFFMTRSKHFNKSTAIFVLHVTRYMTDRSRPQLPVARVIGLPIFNALLSLYLFIYFRTSAYSTKHR